MATKTRGEQIDVPVEDIQPVTAMSAEELQAENERLRKMIDEHILIVKEDTRLVGCPPGCETQDKSKVTSWIRTNDRNISRAKSAGWERNARREDLVDPEASFAYGAYVAADKSYRNGQDLILMIGERAHIEANEQRRRDSVSAGMKAQDSRDEALGIKPTVDHGQTRGGKFYR